jgi:cyclopropane fatty-acyl-phospholipid synthase-like methyltransferase
MNKMQAFWDARYKEVAYAYGTNPNAYFQQVIDSYKLKGKILLPAEGEGRNAVYAASQGLDVYAFDISKEGKHKAEKLAAQNKVQITYEVGDFVKLPLAKLTYDAAAFIYAHFPPQIRTTYHKKVGELIRKNGLIIVEGFSKSHLKNQATNPKVGGPKDAGFLLSIEEIIGDFENFEILELKEETIQLNEGEFHIGTASVIRFVGRKK